MGGDRDLGMVPSKILSRGKEVLKSPSTNFSKSYLSILMLQCHIFAHIQNSTVGNTVTDAAGLVHVHHFVDLLCYCPILVYSQLVL